MMVVRINELKLRPGHSQADFENELCRMLMIQNNNSDEAVPEYEIIRRSIDARKKPELFYVYTVDVYLPRAKAVVKKLRNRHVTVVDSVKYVFPCTFSGEKMAAAQRPVIVGSGPAGLFCSLMLARTGLRPILIERGEDIDRRTKSVSHFWNTGELNPTSNVQFGEGGAGTFSDGKLNSMIKDPDGRVRFVLHEFVKAGADPAILWNNKPHIGTDVLAHVVKNIRHEIIQLGGEVRFETCLTGIKSEKGRYILELNNGENVIQTDKVVLAIGHSARDTFWMLQNSGFAMEAKAFAVGLRAEHSQKLINFSMYGTENTEELGAAPYKLTHKCANGRGVYSFCMCPGGYVVNASSEPGMTAVNGMSYSGRDGKNANSAIVVTVKPEDYRSFYLNSSYRFTESDSNRNCDYPGNDPLAGIVFQQMLESSAWACGKGKIPVQRFEDYCQGIPSCEPGILLPEIKGQWCMTNLRSILPEELNNSIIEGMHAFGTKINGFDAADVLLSGVESRTSSPVRILRDSQFQSITFPGIYPCGEGAGYAGGITSAAVDGIKVAEAVCRAISL
ncbi:MAG: FAD-dependent oxidoreductase [Lachnospiraceae bacterium]|nr:FAD-dependent oxidoreductase [Lachnospiraceae bacterium]